METDVPTVLKVRLVLQIWPLQLMREFRLLHQAYIRTSSYRGVDSSSLFASGASSSSPAACTTSSWMDEGLHGFDLRGIHPRTAFGHTSPHGTAGCRDAGDSQRAEQLQHFQEYAGGAHQGP